MRPSPGEKSINLSYAQLSLWYETLHFNGDDPYRFLARIRSLVPFSPEKLDLTLRLLMQRHPQLLMRVDTGGLSLVQRYCEYPGIQICTGSDFIGDSGKQKANTEDLQLLSAKDGPLFRVYLAPGDGFSDLILNWHHLAGDAWSFGILFNEFKSVYFEEKELPPLRRTYGDFIRFQEEWIAGPDGRRAAAYWKQELQGLVPLRELCSNPQPAGGSRRSKSRRIPLPELSWQDFTPFEIVLAAYCFLLSEYTRRDDVPVLIPMHGRSGRDFYPVIGHFVNPALIRVKFDGLESFSDLLKVIRGKIRRAVVWQNYPFLLVAEACAVPGVPGEALFTEAFCGMQRLPRGISTGPDGERPLQLVDLHQAGSSRQLSLELCEEDHNSYLEIRYPEDRWDRRAVDTLAGALEKILGMAAARPETGLSDFPPLSQQFSIASSPPSSVSSPHQNTGDAYSAPSSPTEKALVKIWESVLDCGRIGIDDDFFAIGGHSLRATQVMTRVMEEFFIRLPLGTLFQAKTIRSLAEKIEAEQPNREYRHTLRRMTVPPGDRIPLSFSQERMWFIHQLEPESAAYNISVAIRLRGNLELDKLKTAFHILQERHEILRSSFHNSEGTPFQLVQPVPCARVSFTDLSAQPGEQRISIAKGIAEEQGHRPFDLESGPPISLSVLRLEDTVHILTLTFHHIIGDQWSLGVISRELTLLYRGERPAPLKLQYRDYALWQREDFTDSSWDDDLRFWKSSLQSLPALELPADRPRPPVHTFRGSAVRFSLTKLELRKIRELSLNLDVTPYMLLLSVFALLLRRLSESSEVSIGTPVANRLKPAFEDLLGTFVNTLVLRIPVNEDLGFLLYLSSVRKIVIEAFEHQNYPFEKVVEALNPERDVSRLPLAQVLFTMYNTPQDAPFDTDLEWDLFTLDHTGVQFDLSLSVDLELSGEIQLQYNEDLFLGETGERILVMYRNLLRAVLENPETQTAALPVMGKFELEKVLFRRNSTRRDFPLDRPLPDFLFARAQAFSASPALRFFSESYSYGELFASAARLANLLQSRNIREGALVGLYMHRSPRLIISLLGIAAAGAAYLPMDPGYPAARLEFMLEQSGAEVLLSESSLAGSISFGGGEILEWEELESRLQGFDSDPPVLAPDPSRLVYVLYTSGSTGNPKGVEIPNRAIVNFLFSMAEVPGFSSDDGILAITPISFDISGLEILLPLFSGGTLFLADRETAGDPVLLKKALENPDITIMQATPSTWRMLLEAGWTGPLKTILCGGEAFPPDLLKPLLDASENLWNMYGPTETTIWSTLARLSSEVHPIPIGRPITNTTVYVLDELMRPVPDGVSGELFIGGSGLALGYRRQQELSRNAFVSNPFVGGELLYRTGDRARILQNGSLVCLGRKDTQIKLNGHRIELAEVEKRLSLHPAISQAVCRIIEYGPGDSRLAACCIPSSQDKGLPDSAELRSYLEKVLPGYMVPGVWIPMESFPLTANGKIDRLRLPRITAHHSFDTTEPDKNEVLSETERKVYSLWQSLLKNGSFGMNDDFFALGGHSLLAVALVAAVQREFSVDFPLRQFFIQPTVRGMARQLESSTNTGHASGPENDVLFVMQRYGNLPPLFIIAGVYAQEDGLYRFLSSLVPHLGSNQPVYGLRPRGLLHPAAPYSSIEEMAGEYLTQIRTLQPKGPYWLIGECVGGVVAYEMARRLLLDNEEVCLVMLDTEYPSRLRRLRNRFFYKAGRIREKLTLTVRLVFRDPRVFLHRVFRFLSFKYRSSFPRTPQEKKLNRFRRVEQRYSDLVYPYSFPYLNATAYLLMNEEDSRYLSQLGWLKSRRNIGKTGPRELIITKIPGNHISRITEYGPNLGGEIRKILDAGCQESRDAFPD